MAKSRNSRRGFSTALVEDHGLLMGVFLSMVLYKIEDLQSQEDNDHFFDGLYWAHFSKKYLIKLFKVNRQTLNSNIQKLVDTGQLIERKTYDRNNRQKVYFTVVDPEMLKIYGIEFDLISHEIYDEKVHSDNEFLRPEPSFIYGNKKYAWVRNRTHYGDEIVPMMGTKSYPYGDEIVPIRYLYNIIVHNTIYNMSEPVLENDLLAIDSKQVKKEIPPSPPFSKCKSNTKSFSKKSKIARLIEKQAGKTKLLEIVEERKLDSIPELLEMFDRYMEVDGFKYVEGSVKSKEWVMVKFWKFTKEEFESTPGVERMKRDDEIEAVISKLKGLNYLGAEKIEFRSIYGMAVKKRGLDEVLNILDKMDQREQFKDAWRIAERLKKWV